MKAQVMNAIDKSNGSTQISALFSKTILTKDFFMSIAIRLAAILAFIAINLIGFSAFSEEIAVKTTLADQVKTFQSRAIESVPVCQLAPEGLVENKWKNIRIQIDGAVVAGAETLNDLSDQLKQLVVEHRCIPLAVPCSFASEGLALGSWFKHRVMVQDTVAFGGNNTARLFEQIGQLKKIGVCQ